MWAVARLPRMAWDMRQKLTATGLLAFAALITAPARSMSPAVAQDDIEVHVHGSGADFIFNSLKKYGASKGLQCTYHPGVGFPDVTCGNGRFVIRAVCFSTTVSIKAYRKYGDSGAQASIVFVISSVMADARANAEIDGISCLIGIKCAVADGGFPAT
jgi:hypothetical protein